MINSVEFRFSESSVIGEFVESLGITLGDKDYPVIYVSNVKYIPLVGSKLTIDIDRASCCDYLKSFLIRKGCEYYINKGGFHIFTVDRITYGLISNEYYDDQMRVMIYLSDYIEDEI